MLMNALHRLHHLDLTVATIHARVRLNLRVRPLRAGPAEAVGLVGHERVTAPVVGAVAAVDLQRSGLARRQARDAVHLADVGAGPRLKSPVLALLLAGRAHCVVSRVAKAQDVESALACGTRVHGVIARAVRALLARSALPVFVVGASLIGVKTRRAPGANFDTLCWSRW